MWAGNRLEFLRATGLFGDVDDAALAQLAPEFGVVRLTSGAALIHHGDSSRGLYLVASGRLQVMAHTSDGGTRPLLYVEAGETISEMSLLSDDPSSTTVRALTDTTVLSLSRAAFDRFADAHPTAALHVIQTLSRRLATYRLIVALHLNNVVDTANLDVLRDLESELQLVTLYGGEVLFRQGEAGDSMCIVISGRVRVTVSDDETGPTQTWELGAGELVGEVGVIANQPRTETVVAIRDTQVARLTKSAFEHLVIKHPTWAVQAVTRKLAERLREAIAGRPGGKQTEATIAVVPVNSSAAIDSFSSQLYRALSQLGRTVHVSSTRVDEHLGRPGIAQTYERGGRNIRVVEWLSRQESEHQYVIYESDRFLSPWTERCIRQADYVILVADAAGDSAPNEIEAELLASHNRRCIARRWLVLTHDAFHEPNGTAAWLDTRTVERHLHVRLGDPAGFDRLARLLTREAVALTLGGGFARGLAHLGVLQAFEELGIPVDAVGASSMGAVVGGMWALGWDRERIVSAIRGACRDHFGDLTFPFVALKRGRRFSQAIRELFGDVQIEDLWVPYFCISANLNRSALRVHTRGSLAKSILASTRSPGVFPPIVYDGELHIDGGVINNVPVDLMKEFGNRSLTVGVDVSPPHQLKPVRDYGDTINGWWAFWRRCFSKNYVYTPSILLVMIRTLEYTGVANERDRRKFADVYMRPDVLGFKRTDFDRAAEIIQAGYDCARTDLQEHLHKFRVVAAVSPRASSTAAWAQPAVAWLSGSPEPD